MVQKGRKKPKKQEASFEFPTSWNDVQKLAQDYPADAAAIVAAILTVLYMAPATSSIAGHVVTFQHNVTDPDTLEKDEYVLYTWGFFDLLFLVYASLLAVAIFDSFNDLGVRTLSQNIPDINVRMTWRVRCCHFFIHILALVGILDLLSQIWIPDGIGFVWLLEDAPQGMSLGSKFFILSYLTMQIHGIVMAFANKELAGAKAVSQGMITSFGLRLAGATLVYVSGLPRLLLTVLTTMLAANLLPDLAALFDIYTRRRTSKTDKERWFKNDNVGLKEIIGLLKMMSFPLQLISVLGSLAFGVYALMSLMSVGSIVAFVGIALLQVPTLLAKTKALRWEA